ncbi:MULTISPECIES: hypothetical protein [Thermomonosporaceae]|uniref:hypothetical protein n=1 Tax=Thermomonosporaceae TaxID=2012 RepID=UPI00255AE787|nr:MULTISPECIES: hypothetical protein [Thermomonosporaceae]MDL4772855.1 hypothetical protein [Actinomadura xylanilytica]
MVAYEGGGGGGYGGFSLDPSWPGLASGKELDIDKDDVKKILKILRDDYEAYSDGSGTLNDIQSNGNITTAQLGDYPAAQSLQASTSAAYSNLNTQYNSFLTSYKSVIDALEKAVENYEDMETNNTATANGVSTSGTSSSNNGNTTAF